MTKISIDGEYIELIKLLKAVGVCDTGGAAKIAVDEGAVKVDGKVENRKRCKIRKGQVVEIDENVIEVE